MGHRALNKHLAVKISKTVNIYVDAGHFYARLSVISTSVHVFVALSFYSIIV